MKLFTLLVSIFLILSHSSANTLDGLAALQPIADPAAIPLSPTGGGTYPRLANVQGAILAAYTAVNGDTHVLTISRSTDGGKSSSAWGTVASGTGPGDLDNPDLIQLSNGNIVCTFRNHDIDNSGNYTFYRITASLSTDGGKSWAYLSQVDHELLQGVMVFGSLSIVFPPATLFRYIMPPRTPQKTRTFPCDRQRMMAPHGQTHILLQAVLLQVEMTTEGSGTLFTVKSVVSNDDGATWGERSQVYVPIGSGNNAGSPQVTTTSGGAFITSFMTDEDTSLHKWPDHGASFKIITSLSSDPAIWGQKTTVSGVQSSWPGLLALTDGTVPGCSDNGGVNCYFISFTST